MYIVEYQNASEMRRQVYVLDYGCGNLGCISNALAFCGYAPVIVSIKDYKDVDPFNSDVFFPGVGNFEFATQTINSSLDNRDFCQWALDTKTFIGICLGFQLLFRSSEEVLSSTQSSTVNGIGILDAPVVKCRSDYMARSLNIGWRKSHLRVQPEVGLTDTNDVSAISNSYFYHMHSYGVRSDNPRLASMVDWCTSSKHLISGEDYISAIRVKNIFGMQFHPEKSGKAGIDLLKAILER